MLSLLRSFLLRSSSISARMVSTNFTVKFYEFGDPLEVLKHDECPIPAIKEADSVLIKMLGRFVYFRRIQLLTRVNAIIIILSGTKIL